MMQTSQEISHKVITAENTDYLAVKSNGTRAPINLKKRITEITVTGLDAESRNVSTRKTE